MPKKKTTRKKRSREEPWPQVEQQRRAEIRQAVDEIDLKDVEDISEDLIGDIRDVFQDHLHLRHVDPDTIHLHLERQRGKDLAESIERLACELSVQTSDAEKVFQLLDVDGKGVVVVEDLKRVAGELLEDVDNDELLEMVEEMDQSSQGLLSLDDMVRIARRVGL